MKYLVLIGVLLAVYLVVRAGRGGGTGRTGHPGQPPASPPARPPSAPTQDMVSCAVCGLHLPRAEALVDPRGRTFCSPEHRDQGT